VVRRLIYGTADDAQGHAAALEGVKESLTAAFKLSL
jgi:hypothetical protein